MAASLSRMPQAANPPPVYQRETGEKRPQRRHSMRAWRVRTEIWISSRLQPTAVQASRMKRIIGVGVPE